MSKILDWGGLKTVEYLNILNVIALTDNVPNSFTVVRLSLEPGSDWINIPFIPESASYSMSLKHNPSGRSKVHTVRFEPLGSTLEIETLSALLERGWYLVRFTDHNNNRYIAGLKDMPGKFSIGNLSTGTNQLTNIGNSLQFTAVTNKRVLKVV